MKGKTTGQTPNNFPISNRDYNTYRYNLSKEKLHFSFHSLLSFSFCNFLTLSIFLFSFACPHSSNSSRLHQSSFSLAGTSIFTGAPSRVHFYSPSSLAEWPLHLFLHLFLLFSLSLSSNQVTINASHLL